MMILKHLKAFISSTNKNDKSRHVQFLKLIKPPAGIHQKLTTEQKAKINQEITKKLEELQSTGLSRQEILLCKSQKGLPLAIDPFFQFIKNNLRAREIYLREADRFTVENVIDIALRQDIGPDTSYARVRQNSNIDNKGRAELLDQLDSPKSEAFNPKDYNANAQFTLQKAKDELKPHQDLRFIYKPIDRYYKKQVNLRKLKKYDIHWRNVELLRQFMTKNGNIKSREKNNLTQGDQTDIIKAIKTARNMAALPYVGRTPEPLKRNITNLQDQVKELGYQHVNLQTGHLYVSNSKSMDSEQLAIEKQNDLDYKYQRMTNEGKGFRLWVSDYQDQKDSDSFKSECYARELKKKENELNKDKVSKSDEALAIVKRITGLRAHDNYQTNIPASNAPQCKVSFEKEKERLLKSLKKPDDIANILLQNKIKI